MIFGYQELQEFYFLRLPKLVNIKIQTFDIKILLLISENGIISKSEIKFYLQKILKGNLIARL